MKGIIFFFLWSKNLILSLGHVRLDFLKVLCLSFPLPVVDLSLVLQPKT